MNNKIELKAKTRTVKVLHAEDDEVDRRLVKRILAGCPQPIEFAVETVRTLSAATEYLNSREYDIALLDLGLPDSSGIETIREVSKANPHIPIVVLTGTYDEEMGLLAIKSGATDYLRKDMSLDALLARTILYSLERKLAEEKLKKANKKLKEYNRLKDEFVSTASHELRTPLSIIMGAIRLVLDEIPGKIVEEQRDVLATAMESVQRLNRILDSLLSISRIESGKLDLQKTVVNICQLIKDTVSNYGPLAREKDICLDCEVPEQAVDICLDPDKTKQVLTNLISNSLKFTPEGGWVKVTCADQDEEVQICVADCGVGIAKQDIPKLFDKFTQFGRKAGPGEKGTGLGLAIAKKLVEMHGGKIQVESEVNQGTTFTVSLPLTTEAAAEDLPAETDELVEKTLVKYQ